MTTDVERDFAAGGVANMNRVFQLERLHQGCEIVRIGVAAQIDSPQQIYACETSA